MVQPQRALISILIPAYNEGGIVQKNLARVVEHLRTLEHRWRWEVVLVDDGSSDGTGDLARAVAADHDHVRVLSHPSNFRLGQALRYGFSECRGDIIVVLDLDLTYAPDHIERLVERMQATPAKIVLASPYMKGGRTTNVPWLRRVLSRWGNRFLALTARGVNQTGGNVSTLTGMVRAYDAQFLRALHLKSIGMEINIEILYKAMIVGAYIEEIPAHLDWTGQVASGGLRSSSKRIGRGILFSLLAGFIIRPFAFFIIPGILVALAGGYTLAWIAVHVVRHYRDVAVSVGGNFDSVLSEALARSFQQSPHAFIVGGIALMVAIQLVSLGVLALQAKQYFEEVFHLGVRLNVQAQRTETLLRALAASSEDTPGR